MLCKIKNILLLFIVVLVFIAKSRFVEAQGIVTLSDEAIKNDNLNQDIPNEISLFADDVETVDELGGIKDDKALINKDQKKEVNTETNNAKEDDAVNSNNVVSKDIQTGYENKTAPINNEEDMPIMADKLFSTKGAGVGILGTNEQTPMDEEIFSQMSDIEKQTALLNLELRREKIRNEIEAIKNQRKQAVVDEQEKKEAQRREKIEWEKEQEQKVLQEQQKLRELDIQFENARQEKLLNAYKNQMLAENQKWIAHNGELYKQIEQLKEEKLAIYDDSKKKFENINVSAQKAIDAVKEINKANKKQISDLETQISILKARIEAQEQEMSKQNPFAEGDQNSLSVKSEDIIDTDNKKMADLYAVMEIRGQGGELIAKLINKEGLPFYVKKGTTLQSGHIVDEITSTYVRAEKDGLKDYLYFAAGGILPLEQPISTILPKETSESSSNEDISTSFVSSDGIPGLGKSMIVR